MKIRKDRFNSTLVQLKVQLKMGYVFVFLRFNSTLVQLKGRIYRLGSSK